MISFYVQFETQKSEPVQEFNMEVHTRWNQLLLLHFKQRFGLEYVIFTDPNFETEWHAAMYLIEGVIDRT